MDHTFYLSLWDMLVLESGYGSGGSRRHRNGFRRGSEVSYQTTTSEKAIKDFSDKERLHSLKKGGKAGSPGKENQEEFGNALSPAS